MNDQAAQMMEHTEQLKKVYAPVPAKKGNVRQFLDTMFSELTEGEHVVFNLCPPKGHPGLAISVKELSRKYPENPNQRAYVGTSTVTEIRNKLEFFSALHFVVLDDIGTKCEHSALPAALQFPTSKVETSAGNFQYGYKLVPPVRDKDQAKAFVSALYDAGPWDGGGALATKYVRLPAGIHGKTDFKVRLDELHPYQEFTAEGLLEAAGTSVEATKTKTQTNGNGATYAGVEPADDPLLDRLVSAGMVVYDSGEWINIICPWHEHHSDSHLPDNQTAGYRPKGRGGDEWKGQRGFMCHHDNCAGRSTKQFIEHMNKTFDMNLSATAAIPLKMQPRPDAEEESTNAVPDLGDVSLDDFLAHMPDHKYIFVPTRDLWPAVSVNARVEHPMGPDGKPIKPSEWLDANAPVEQMTWAPGFPAVIKHKLMDAGGWIRQPNCACFNLYRPPKAHQGDPAKAGPWIEHVHTTYPDEAEHIIHWLAHQVQYPAIKTNHALVLGGKPGIGKDTLLEPIKQAIGPWNFPEVAPTVMLQEFNGYAKSVVLRISEARDLGDVDRFKFYEHMKSVIAAPPDVIRVNEKFLREYYVPNVCGVIFTTNNKTNGLYLPPDDRRHFVAWSDLPENPFSVSYWDERWTWYEKGGYEHVAAYLAELDLSGFNAKAPPKKTEAFWHMVNTNRASEDAELADVLDLLRQPAAVTLDIIKAKARQQGSHDFADWLTERKNRGKIPHRLESAGYEPVRNKDAQDGLWKIEGKRQAVYGKVDLSIRDQGIAAAKLV